MIEHARSERTRSVELQKQSELLTHQLVESLRRFKGPAFGESGRDTFTLRLARLRPAVALLRHDLARWLESRGVAAADVQDVALACSEACANAVEHPISATQAAFEVEATHRNDELVIAVRDSGRWRSGPTSESRGRGMQLIRSLMDDVEVVQSAGGTEIVMRRRLR